METTDHDDTNQKEFAAVDLTALLKWINDLLILTLGNRSERALTASSRTVQLNLEKFISEPTSRVLYVQKFRKIG